LDRVLLHGANAALPALIVLCVVWEMWLAPLRPGGSWAVLKALPLLAPLFGMLHGRRYTAQWSSMLVLGYAAEGIVRAWSEQGPARSLALIELALSVVYFVCAVGFARSKGRTVRP
jgi:uncharacterized membrane protein